MWGARASDGHFGLWRPTLRATYCTALLRDPPSLGCDATLHGEASIGLLPARACSHHGQKFIWELATGTPQPLEACKWPRPVSQSGLVAGPHIQPPTH